MTLLEQIPGLATAIEHEQLVRNASFLELTERVCGFEVPPLTLRHMLALESIGSPLVCGGRPMPHDFGAFLVLLTGATGFRRWNLLRRLGRVNYGIAFDDIVSFINEAMQDSPGGSNGEGEISYYSFGAAIVDRLAREYGWSERAILDLPLKRLFQYLKLFTGKDGKVPLFNPSDKVRGKYLAELNRK
jgi:hypothetical protein